MDSAGTISTISRLLLSMIISPQYQEPCLINQLNDYYSFDYNVFVLESTVDRHRFFNVSTPQTVLIFETVDNATISLETLKSWPTESKNTLLIMAPAGVNFEENLNWLDRITDELILDVNMKFGIFFADAIPIDDVRKLLEWFWEFSIVHVFVAFESNVNPQASISDRVLNVLRLQISETSDVINLTGKEWYRNVFPSNTLNFHQYPIDCKRRSVKKADIHTWQLIARNLNASVDAVSGRNVHVHQTSDLFSELETCFGDSLNMMDIEHLTGFYYPMSQSAKVLIVPEALPYTKFTNYLTAIVSNELFISNSIMILAPVSLLTCVRYNNKKNINFFASVGAKRFVVVLLTFGGFFIATFVMSMFQRHLTRPYKQAEINTVEDVYKSPYKIKIRDRFQRSHYMRILNDLWENEGWLEKFQIMDRSEIVSETPLLRSDNHVLHIIDLEQAKHLLDLQNELNIRAYRIPPKVGILHKGLYGYYICGPFVDRFNDMFHRIQSAGLYRKWKDDDQQLWLRQVRLTINTTNEKRFTDSTGDHLFYIIYGWITASVVLVLETFWAKVEKFKIVRADSPVGPIEI